MDQEQMNTQRLDPLGILAGGIAHDFNNILVGILGNTNLIQLDKKELNPFINEYLENIVNTVNRASDLTRQLLTFSKGGSPLIQAENIETIIHSSVKLVMSGSKSKCNINFEKKLPLVDVDPSQIQ